ncbi:MAG TPA: hypothetical protein VEY69_18475 [Lautropia sp.]|nr:hypothetical protein [Lautropia sp.]
MPRDRSASLRSLCAAAFASTLLSACVGLQTSAPDSVAAPGGSPEYLEVAASVRECMAFMEALDGLVHVGGTSDGGEHRVPGFPYLRVDRFTASFAEAVATDEARYRAWVDRMREMDEYARSFEIANLPDEAFPVMRTLSRDNVVAKTQACGSLLVVEHALAPQQRRRLPGLAVVPDDYITARRVLGLYALSGIPFAAGERSWERHTEQVFADQRKAPPPAALAYQRYVPREQPLAASEALAQSRAAMAASPVDALGIPQIDAASRQRLFEAFAPTFQIATHAEYDRFGPLQWIDLEGLVARDAQRYWLDVDPSQAVVYQRLAFTRHGRSVLPQLVYTIWFSERPMQDTGDLLAGRLDGLVWRVTLDEQGQPLLYDTVQPSGRFAMFFPTSRLRAKPRPENEPLTEWAFSPIDQPLERWLGAASGIAGVSLHIESQTHQVVGIGMPGEAWGEPVASNAPYRMADYDRLRALPLPGRGTRSIFDANGVVPNTERSARFLFWPMGISSPGSMRQSGRQPTAFIGRRHFDDADLLEKRFERVR